MSVFIIIILCCFALTNVTLIVFLSLVTYTILFSDMDQIKAHFFGSHAELNKFSIIPRGLGFAELLSEPHNRNELPLS